MRAYIVGPEALSEISASHRDADIFDEPAHELKRGINETRYNGLSRQRGLCHDGIVAYFRD